MNKGPRPAKVYTTAEEVEEAFYRAFERADLDAMRQVWERSDAVECVHPVGPRLRGPAVIDSWREMFRAPQRLAFHIVERHMIPGETLAVHTLIENIVFAEGASKPLRILTTNVYRRGEEGWRLLLRHASPAPLQEQDTRTPSAAVH